jgi:hypothetical protein
LLGQAGRLTFCYQPTWHIAAENVQDDVQVIVGPLGWPFELAKES